MNSHTPTSFMVWNSLPSINFEVNLPYSACFLKRDSHVKKPASRSKREK